MIMKTAFALLAFFHAARSDDSITPPLGYHLLLRNEDTLDFYIVDHYHTLQLNQKQLLIDENNLMVYDGGGTGVAAILDDRGPLGYFSIMPDGRTYNTYDTSTKCNADYQLGRVALFRPRRRTANEKPLPASALSALGDIGYPGDKAWPKMKPVRFAFRYNAHDGTLIPRSLTVSEELQFLWFTEWHRIAWGLSGDKGK